LSLVFLLVEFREFFVFRADSFLEGGGMLVVNVLIEFLIVRFEP
jgi:hypothetical protein